MRLNAFARFAWVVLGFALLVILWGAVVRATGSGAGCGSHWPLCDGQVIPRSPQTETLIEYGHRLTSGSLILLTVGLVVWAFRAYPGGHRVRLGAGLSGVFIISEVLIGAGLVVFNLVAYDDSVARAIALSIHLANTFVLLSVLALTAWWASGGAPVCLRGQGGEFWLVVLALLGALLIGMTGAVNALGDTLFPAGSLAEGLRQDLSPVSHILVRLRIIHPVVSVVAGLYLLFVAGHAYRHIVDRALGQRLAGSLIVFVLIQFVVGLVNVALRAPVWMQLVHLFLADITWLALVLLSATLLACESDG